MMKKISDKALEEYARTFNLDYKTHLNNFIQETQFYNWLNEEIDCTLCNGTGFIDNNISYRKQFCVCNENRQIPRYKIYEVKE